MYQALLCLRYLRTRYIALASIISVMLGVATMIVVNSVMAGFKAEMHKRLHGILADVVFETLSLSGTPDAEGHMAEIRSVLGNDQVVAGMTAVVTVPAMISIKVRDQWITRQVNVIGIDDKTYASVSDFSQYLLHARNRERLSFDLRDGGYDTIDREGTHKVKERGQLKEAGWKHRQARISYEQAVQRHLDSLRRVGQRADEAPIGSTDEAAPEAAVRQTASEEPLAPSVAGEEFGPPIPVPGVVEGAAAGDSDSHVSRPTSGPFGATPFSQRSYAPAVDEATQQYAGVILGIGIASVRRKTPGGEVEDYFLAVPGDDVKITFPTAGTPPKAVTDTFTIVDFYESKMSEYDSGFAFVPLSKLQYLRGMIDPTGTAAFTSIQIKLQPGVELNAVRDKLREHFPPTQYPYRVQTWMDLQGPLLQAVQMETTILNILLFMIIAVAGFGILATFYMIVVEKTRDIGTMKALGAPSGGVLTIFLTYGFSLGVVGAGVGALLGLAFVWKINDIAACIEWITGREVFDPTIYYFREIPTIVQPWTICWIVAGAILIAVLASILPALRAARMHPVEALRYE